MGVHQVASAVVVDVGEQVAMGVLEEKVNVGVHRVGNVVVVGNLAGEQCKALGLYRDFHIACIDVASAVESLGVVFAPGLAHIGAEIPLGAVAPVLRIGNFWNIGNL